MGFIKIVGIEVCGFFFGVLLVIEMGIGFVLVRKFNKFFCEVVSESYEFEYGMDILEIYKDVIELGDKVFFIDDLFVIGGMIVVFVKLICLLGGEVNYVGFVINLLDLGGEKKLSMFDIESYFICEFEGE